MELDLLRELDGYLSKRVSLEQFRLDLAKLTWDNPEAPVLAHQIEHVIDETSSGNLSIDEMDECLADLASSARPLVG